MGRVTLGLWTLVSFLVRNRRLGCACLCFMGATVVKCHGSMTRGGKFYSCLIFVKFLVLLLLCREYHLLSIYFYEQFDLIGVILRSFLHLKGS